MLYVQSVPINTPSSGALYVVHHMAVLPLALANSYASAAAEVTFVLVLLLLGFDDRGCLMCLKELADIYGQCPQTIG